MTLSPGASEKARSRDAASAIFAGFVAAQAFVGRSPLRLHLGCGTVLLEGWVNIDIEGAPDLRLDMRYGLPFPDASVDLIHSEHVFEHFPLPIGRLLIHEAYRVLKPGGVMRIAMPDLEVAVRRYLDDDWRDQEWIRELVDRGIDTPAAYLNLIARGWGHEYLYDEADMRRRLLEAGFAHVRRVELGASEVPALRNLETRPESELIMEAVR